MVPARGGGGECTCEDGYQWIAGYPSTCVPTSQCDLSRNITAVLPGGLGLEQGDVVLPAALQRLLYVRGLGPRWRVQEPGPELLSGAVAHDKWDLLLA